MGNPVAILASTPRGLTYFLSQSSALQTTSLVFCPLCLEFNSRDLSPLVLFQVWYTQHSTCLGFLIRHGEMSTCMHSSTGAGLLGGTHLEAHIQANGSCLHASEGQPCDFSAAYRVSSFRSCGKSMVFLLLHPREQSQFPCRQQLYVNGRVSVLEGGEQG